MIIIDRRVDQFVQIGGDTFVGPTDIDRAGVRLIARGRTLGGVDDGSPFHRAVDLGLNGELRLGPHLVVTVVDLLGEEVRLGVQAPENVPVRAVDRMPK